MSKTKKKVLIDIEKKIVKNIETFDKNKTWIRISAEKFFLAHTMNPIMSSLM